MPSIRRPPGLAKRLFKRPKRLPPQYAGKRIEDLEHAVSSYIDLFRKMRELPAEQRESVKDTVDTLKKGLLGTISHLSETVRYNKPQKQIILELEEALKKEDLKELQKLVGQLTCGLKFKWPKQQSV